MPEHQEFFFEHEKLSVYQEAISFIAWLTPLLETSARLGDVKDQLDRASTSIALNIAEGNGKYALKDRCRFFDTAHASALNGISRFWECEAPAGRTGACLTAGRCVPESRKPV